MQLIDTWFDTLHKIENKLYKFESGLRFLHSVNPNTIDFDIALILKGGSYFERQVGVPHGTAHFLEHMLCNPNKVLKTKSAQDRFKFGTKKKAEIVSNAWTSRKFMQFHLHGNQNAANRMIDYLTYQVDYPIQDFKKHIEKERNVILAEESQHIKLEKDTSRIYEQFLLGKSNKEFQERVIGSSESIQKISINHLTDLHSSIFNAKTSILAIQSPSSLSDQQISKIQRLDQLFPGNKTSLSITKRSFPNEFDYRHFNDPDRQSVYFSASELITKETKEYNYRQRVLRYLLYALIFYLANEEIREKAGLIYGTQTFWYDITWELYIRGFNASCTKENLLKTLNGYFDVMDKTFDTFLNKTAGKRWFESTISRYVFERTKNHNSEHAEREATAVLENVYKFDHEKHKRAALDLSFEEFIAYALAFKNKPLKFWFESNNADEEIIGIFKKSKFYQKMAD